MPAFWMTGNLEAGNILHHIPEWGARGRRNEGERVLHETIKGTIYSSFR